MTKKYKCDICKDTKQKPYSRFIPPEINKCSCSLQKPEADRPKQIPAVRRSGRPEPSPETKERLKYMGLAIEEIKKVNGLKGREKPKGNVGGTITCPKCKNKLHYAISGYNGHIWGNCESEDCLSWMM